MENINNVKKKIGLKECKKAVQNDNVLKAFIAQDVDERVIAEFKDLCNQKSVEVIQVDTMKDLGKACGIDVGASTVVILKH